MATSRISTSSILQGFPKSRSLLAGNAAYDPAATFLIQRTAGNGSNTSITFSSIPQTYKHLQIRCLSRNSSGGSGNANLNIRLNSDSGSNYTRHYLRGDGSSASAYGDISSTYAIVQDGDLNWTASSLYKAVSIIDIHDYSSSTKNKTVRSLAGADVNASGYGVSIGLSSALWVNTAAVTSITITSSGATAFDSTSTFALYGMVG